MSGFNDNSITVQWSPQSMRGYRINGCYLEETATGQIVWTGTADTTQATLTAQKGYSGRLRLYYNVTSNYAGTTSNYLIDSVYVNTTPADVTKNNFGIKDVYVNIKKVAFAVNKPDTATGVQLEVYNAKNRRVLSKTARTMGYESMNVSKDMAYKYRARYYYTNDSNNQTYYGKWSDYRYFAMPSISGKTTNKKKGIKVVLKKGTYYVQVVPKVKFGNKSYSSDVVTVASAYVYK